MTVINTNVGALNARVAATERPNKHGKGHAASILRYEN